LVAQEGGAGNNADKLVRIPGEGEAGEGSSTEEWVDADVVSGNSSFHFRST